MKNIIIPVKNFYVAETYRTGKGVFTPTPFKKGEFVFELEGEHKEFQSVTAEDTHLYPNWVGIGSGNWIDPAHPFIYLNHSCDPNLGILGEATFVALHDIKEGEELTFDYAITEDELLWHMDCSCGTEKCRSVIRSIQFLPHHVFKSYLPYIGNYFQEVHHQALHQRNSEKLAQLS